jgi:TP901 family phage tail tape measure protein
MADNQFQIKITIDGEQVAPEAKRMRKAIEQELTEAFSVDFDISGGMGGLLEDASRPADAVVEAWEAAQQEIGSNVIPQLVAEINAWLERIGVDRPFTELAAQSAEAAEQILRDFRSLNGRIPTEALEERISTLRLELQELEREMQDLTTRSSGASAKYRAEFQQAVEEARKLRGRSPEDEALYADGYLPTGVGIGGESGYFAGGAEGSEADDEWYRALDTSIEEAKRLGAEDAARLDELTEKIIAKEAQLSALLASNLEHTADEYREALSEASDPAEMERLYNELENVQRDFEQARQRFADAVAEVVAQAEQELDEAASKAEAAAKAAERTPEGRVSVEAAKQQTASVEAAEQRKTEIVREEAKRRTELARAEAEERKQLAKQETIQVREEEKRKTQAAAQSLKQREKYERRLAAAKEKAAELGISWQDVIAKEIKAGRSLDAIIGAMRGVEREQRRVERGAGDIADEYRRGQRFVDRFAESLEDAQRKQRGVTEVARGVEDAGRQLQFAGTAVTGALTVAARDYQGYLEQTGRGARSLEMSAEMVDRYRQALIDQAGEAGFKPDVMAEGVKKYAQALGQRVETEQQMQSTIDETIPMLQLAQMAEADLGLVVDATANSLNQFRLEADETNRVIALMNQVADDTTAEVDSVAETFSYAAGQAGQLGMSVEELSAMTAMLADVGLVGSRAGTALDQMLKNIAAPTNKAKEQMEALFGTESPFYDAEGRFIGIAQTIDKMAAATENLSEEERNAAMATLFTRNARRAAIELVDKQIAAREDGINVIQRETEAMTEAPRTWTERLEAWEEDDERILQRTQARWSATWRQIGKGVIETTLPSLERAGTALDAINQFATDHPAIVGWAAKVAAGTVAIGTLTNLGGMTMRNLQMLRNVVSAVRDALSGGAEALEEAAAGKAFEAQVTSAGEQFRALIVSAAQEAAATEQTGAETETATEVTGGKTETATEVAGGKTETSLELAGAKTETAIETSGAGAETGAEIAGGAGAAAAGAGGAAAAGGVSLASILAALGTGAGALAASGGVLLGGGLNELLARTVGGPFQTTGKWAAVGAHAAGGLFGEETGDDWALAVGKFFGEIDEGTEGLSRSADAMAQRYRAMQDAMTSADGVMDAWNAKLQQDQYDITPTIDPAEQMRQLNEDQVDAVETYIEMRRKEEEAVEELNADLAQAADDLEEDLDAIDDRFADLAQEERDFQTEQAKRAADFHREQQRAEAEHQRELARMREDHLWTMSDLAAQRDALAMVKEQRRYARERKRKKEDFRRQQGQRAKSFQREQQERAEQFEARIAQEREALRQERRERIRAHQQEVQELREHHREKMRERRREQALEIAAEIDHQGDKRTVIDQYHQAMYEDLEAWLGSYTDLWADYVASLPTPQSDETHGIIGGRQTGGYIDKTGAYRMHRGEFVLNPQTTRQTERYVGPLTQQRLIAGMAGAGGRQSVTVRYNDARTVRITGALTAQERADLRREIREETIGGVNEALRNANVTR